MQNSFFSDRREEIDAIEYGNLSAGIQGNVKECKWASGYALDRIVPAGVDTTEGPDWEGVCECE